MFTISMHWYLVWKNIATAKDKDTWLILGALITVFKAMLQLHAATQSVLVLHAV